LSQGLQIELRRTGIEMTRIQNDQFTAEAPAKAGTGALDWSVFSDGESANWPKNPDRDQIADSK
jgi:hypothetical protein